MATNLLSVLLVTSGSRGDKLLFRYPLEETKKPKRRRAPVLDSLYAVLPDIEDQHQNDTGCEVVAAHPLQGYTYSVLANLLAPKNALCGQAFEVIVDNMVFVGQPSLASHTPRRKHKQYLQQEAEEDSTTFLFNVVFVLEQSNCSRAVIDAYRDCSRRFAIALAHEEKRCKYLGEQARLIVTLQEELATERAMEPEEVPPVLMFSEVLRISSVAKDLCHGFDSLQKDGTLRVRINKFIDVSFCLPNAALPDYISLALPSTSIQLRPYHACLLLDDMSSLVQDLPNDGSPPLLRLIRSCTPVKSMLTLSHDTDLPLTQVFHLVSHLVYWRKATVIYPLCESNVYILAPNANFEKVSPLAVQYMSEFGDVSLSAVMSYFSSPTPLGQQHLPSGLVPDLVRTVVWLLQHGLLSQVHTYVFLQPVQDKEAVSRTSTPDIDNILLPSSCAVTPARTSRHARHLSNASSSTDKDPDSAHDNVLTELGKHLNESELQAVLGVDASQNPEDLELFAKLCPYFHGKQHLEEMMYYENVTRSQLLTLLDKYSSILVAAVHEDAAIAGDGS